MFRLVDIKRAFINPSFINGLKIEFTSPENLPSPLFTKEGYNSSLFLLGEPACVRGQREVRRDFIKNVVTILRPLINARILSLRLFLTFFAA